MAHDHDHSCSAPGHSHHHGHAHEHVRSGHRDSGRGAIKAAFLITASFMVVEAAGGFLTGSIALLSDSMHMLTDAAALGMSFFASHVSARRPDQSRTYGYHRAEVVAALANAMLLWVLSGYMLREVYERFQNPVPVLSGPMLAIAALGLAANIVSARLLHAHSHGNINIRGAFLHVVGDMAGSVAALIAGAIIHFTGWYRADTVVSLLIIALILFSSARLLSEAFHILMEGAPPEVPLGELQKTLLAIDGVSGVHELHAWSLSSGFNAVSAHLIVKDPARQQAALKEATARVASAFGVRHSVFQVEAEPVSDSSCDICSG